MPDHVESMVWIQNWFEGSRHRVLGHLACNMWGATGMDAASTFVFVFIVFVFILNNLDVNVGFKIQDTRYM